MVEACSNLAEGCSLHFVHLPWLVKLCALNLSGNLSGSSLQHHLVSCQWEEALDLILFGHFSVSFQQQVFADMAFSWQQLVDACLANAKEVACLVDVGKDLLFLETYKIQAVHVPQSKLCSPPSADCTWLSALELA